MTRRLRLKCPACRVALEVACSAESVVDVTCPKCDKRFAAKVTSTHAKPATGGARVAQADDDLWNALAVPPAPVLSPTSFPTVAPSAYYGAPSRDGIIHQIWFWPVAMLLCLAVAVPVVWFGSGLVSGIASRDWSSVSLIPDTHQRLMADYLSTGEAVIQWNLAADHNAEDYRTKLNAYVKGNQQVWEQTLLRAVKLPKADRTQKAPFEQRVKALGDKYRDQLIAKTKAALAGADGLRSEDLESDTELKEAVSISSAAAAFVLSGLWDLPEPENEIERVYYDEAELVREFLRSLACVNSKRQAQYANSEVAGQADRMVDIAVRRAALPRTALERVPREYVDIERAFSITQKVLVQRIERICEVPEELQIAIDDFAYARRCIVSPPLGDAASDIRTAFNEMRAARKTNSELDNPAPAETRERDLVIKPSPNPAARPLAATPAPASGAREVVVPYDHPSAASGSSSPYSNSQPGNSQAGGSQAGGSPSDNRTPQSNPFGSDRMPRFGAYLPPTLPHRESDGRGIPSDRGNRGGYTGPEPPLPRFPTPPTLDSQLESFSGPSAVIIHIMNTKRNLSGVMKQLTERLYVRESFSRTTNGTAVIGLRYAGPVENVASLIDFGTTLSVDSQKRLIVIDDK